MDERIVKAIRSLVSTYREFEQASLGKRMSLPQYRLLLFLQNFGPRKATDIASVYLLKKPTVAELLATVEAKGWTVRSPSDFDRRSSMIVITPRGRKALKDFELVLGEALEKLIQGDDREPILTGLEHFHGAFLRLRSERMVTLAGYRKPSIRT